MRQDHRARDDTDRETADDNLNDTQQNQQPVRRNGGCLLTEGCTTVHLN